MGKPKPVRAAVSAIPQELFPHHSQRNDMACGVACIRMVQEWLDGYAESEAAWSARAISNGRGLTFKRLLRQVSDLAGDRASVSTVAPTKWKHLPSHWTNGTVYILLVDWFYEGSRGRAANEGHYLVVHRITTGPGLLKTGHAQVAVLQDPGSSADAQYWSWTSLLALRTHGVIEIRPTA